jgi:hypothetical protein
MINYLNNIDRSIIGGNIEDINKSNLIFLLEDHDNQVHKNFNTQVIEKFCNPIEDMILVEEDSTKSLQELKLKSIPFLSKTKYHIAGWDDHDSCQKVENFYANSTKLDSIKFAFQELLLTIGTFQKRNDSLRNRVFNILSNKDSFRKVFVLIGHQHAVSGDDFIKFSEPQIKQNFSKFPYLILDPSRVIPTTPLRLRSSLSS